MSERPEATAPSRRSSDAPDPRFALANERTFLAYVRTSIALIAGGVAVEQLGSRVDSPALRHVSAAVLLVLGLVAALGGYLRWRAVEAAIRSAGVAPPTRLPQALALGLIAVIVVAAVVVSVGH